MLASISQQAQQAFETAMKVGYVEACVYNGIAMTLRCIGSHEEAIENLAEAVRRDPNNVDFLCNRSQCLMDPEVGDPKGAE